MSAVRFPDGVARREVDQLDIFAQPIVAPTPQERPGPSPDTDCGWLLGVLSDGREHTLNDILRRSFSERGCGLTVHSRASDLRRRWGYQVEWRHESGAARGASSVYWLP